MLQWPQPMDEDYSTELEIMSAAKANLVSEPYKYSGTSVDLYQFSHDPTESWNQGNIFHANRMEDLSFAGGMIEASDDNNKRDAVFSVYEANNKKAVEDMMKRSLMLKHVGILKPFVAGYNTQIAKVVAGYSVRTTTLQDWLEEQKQKPRSASIPPEVQQMLRTCYQAFETMWTRGYTSDFLANACSYQMVENKIKIDPLCIRDKGQNDTNKMPFRRNFSTMILNHICDVWKDVELEDFIALLKNPRAADILGAPVLLLPAYRELMYHNFDKARTSPKQDTWLQQNADPGVDWKTNASNVDPALKTIIDLQAQHDEQWSVGFSPNFGGALHFASIVTSHYQQHFKGQWVKGQVDLVLRQVLPRLLSRRYNAQYIY